MARGYGVITKQYGMKARKWVSGILAAIALFVLIPDVGLANPNIPYIGPSARYANPPEGVRCVQRAVGVTQDGQFGNETYAAVKRFQAKYKLVQDGIVGPLTGDQIIMTLPESQRFNCAKYVPTSFLLMNDNGRTAEGGVVKSCNTATGQNCATGAAVANGQSGGRCAVQAVVGRVLGVGQFVKVVWQRKLPTPSEALKGPTPLTGLAAVGSVFYCVLIQ
jgi:peptidoglycan hydrolase-like protein with peptidoglycan-binding domain